jgi:Ser/Thr protein kinase RdoA (MazF antagonist)
MTLEARFGEVGRVFGIPERARWSVLPGGHINATRRAQWAGGDVLLQRVNPAVFPDPEIPCRNGARVLAHLAGKGVPIPQAMPAPGGASWLKEDDGCWRAFAFLGTHGGAERMPERAPEAGRALGAVLAALEDFPASQLAPALPGYHALDHHRARFSTHRKAEHALGPEAWAQHGELEAALGSDPLGGPTRVIHGDTKLANVLLPLAPGLAPVVVDFDTVLPGTLAMDFGDFLRSVASPKEQREAEAAETLLARLSAAGAAFLEPLGPLSEECLPALARAPAAMAWMLAQRFLTDHLEGDRYFAVATRGDNLQRGLATLALAHRLLALAPALTEALARP